VHVRKLRLTRYRNFTSQEVEFCPGTNLFLGENGQGKTNLLEAIYLFGYARSFRTSAVKECIQHGSQECVLNAEIAHGSILRALGISISLAGDKQLMLHRKPVGLAEFIGNLHSLAFTQEHLKVVRGGPGERRAFLDRAMVTVCPGHLQRLTSYARALKQRNHLLAAALASGRTADGRLLDSWDEKLAEEGSHVLLNRQEYVGRIKQELVNAFSDTETLEIDYEATGADTAGGSGRGKEAFLGRLAAARARDEKRGFTSVGPHRDDVKLLLNGKKIADFGSAGQQRSCLLTLYFAQMEIHRKTCGFYPVFLMDDVEAELDDRRLRAFLEHLSHRTQTFLTTAKERALPSLGADALRFRVREGRICPAD
jgi:DNA replication and repair protein RecF